VRRKIGYLSGDTGVYERMTAREMVAYFGRLHGMGEADIARRTAEIFATLRMDDFADRMAGTYSAGQKQKTSIARTIVHDPRVLVFDEPTANLDVLVARTVQDFLAEARARGTCIVLSTHIFSEVERLADDVVVIHHGRVLADGSLQQVAGGRRLEEAFFSLVDPGEEP
jgi:sodium transport system ATP-binding protein